MTVQGLIDLLKGYPKDRMVFISDGVLTNHIDYVSTGIMEKTNGDGTYDVVLIGYDTQLTR